MTNAVLLVTVLALQTQAPSPPPLYPDLGSYHFPITTSVPRAQEYFDQGIRLVYGFNHAEAIRAFAEAARLDPACAMCYWGIALAWGPNINAPMDSAAGVEAHAAVERAGALAPRVSAREQAYIQALGRRYPSIPPADRARLDSAYARAMADVAGANPNDLDAHVLYADAIMNLSPWNYWEEGAPRPQTTEFINHLEYALTRNPDHAGACHFYIHAVEAVQPEKAVACADRLPSLMPGAGHIVHMPAHVYVRVGRYNDAVARNEHAVHDDEAYIADQRPQGLYPLGYYPHNYHFLAFAATMAGRGAVAIGAARRTVAVLDPNVAALVPFLESVPAYAQLVLVTFGRWEDALREPLPPRGSRTATGLAHYARGVALAATGRAAEARVALDSVTAIAVASRAARPDHGATMVLEIAVHALTAEIALRGGRPRDAVTHFDMARGLEDQLPYDEPPPWYYPIRQSLGRAYLAASRAADAERVYQEDLAKFPENGWSLFGLAQSLDAQNRSAEAAAVRTRFERAWQRADVTLTASRF